MLWDIQQYVGLYPYLPSLHGMAKLQGTLPFTF